MKQNVHNINKYFPTNKIPLWSVKFDIYHGIKCGTLYMITFTGGVTLGTFYKEKMIRVE